MKKDQIPLKAKMYIHTYTECFCPIGSPGPELISAAFPDQRSPCSRAGLIVIPVKKLGSFGCSCVHNLRA